MGEPVQKALHPAHVDVAQGINLCCGYHPPTKQVQQKGIERQSVPEQYLDGAPGDAEDGLGVQEDLVPHAALQVALHLGQVKVGPAALAQQLPRVVEKVQAEIKQAPRHRPA